MQRNAKEIAEEIKKAITDENEAAMKSVSIDLGVFVLDAFARYSEGLHRLAAAVEDHTKLATDVHKAKLVATKK